MADEEASGGSHAGVAVAGGLGVVVLAIVRALSSAGDDVARVGVHLADDLTRSGSSMADDLARGGGLAEEVAGGGRLGEGSASRLAEEVAGEAAQAGVELAVEGVAADGEGGRDEGLWLGVVRDREPVLRAVAGARGRTIGLVVVGDDPAAASHAALAAACHAASAECWAFLLPTAVPVSAAERAWADSGEKPVAPEGGLVVVWR